MRKQDKGSTRAERAREGRNLLPWRPEHLADGTRRTRIGPMGHHARSPDNQATAPPSGHNRNSRWRPRSH
jgi:hypothetical protein